MKDFVEQIKKEFEGATNPEVAAQQKRYMKHHFEFLGIQAKERRAIQKPFLTRNNLPPKESLEEIVRVLWDMPYREFQYLGQELAQCFKKEIEAKDITLFEYMVLNKSWWDTVDFIADKLIGNYFFRFPDQRNTCIQRWIESGNIWLQRSALLFQLGYKDNLDTSLLENIITPLTDSREFFIEKAIGWILREYGKTNPEWVIEFASQTQLSPLSRREALRIILSNKP